MTKDDFENIIKQFYVYDALYAYKWKLTRDKYDTNAGYMRDFETSKRTATRPDDCAGGRLTGHSIHHRAIKGRTPQAVRGRVEFNRFRTQSGGLSGPYQALTPTNLEAGTRKRQVSR